MRLAAAKRCLFLASGMKKSLVSKTSFGQPFCNINNFLWLQIKENFIVSVMDIIRDH